jgi:hypothetical protein
VHQFGDPPAAEIRDPEVTDLARLDQRPHRGDGLGERRLRVVDMQIVDVDPVGTEPREARLACLHDPAARQAARMRAFVAFELHDVADLRRQDPPCALRADCRAGDLFRRAAGVDVGGVDEVDAILVRMRDDPARFAFVGPVAEHHRAQADR